MGKFVISVRKNGGYQFNLKAGNGEVILTSEGYTSKSSCINGIESVKTNSLFDSRFEHKTSADGKYYFNLKAGNGQIIGTSEMYTEASGRNSGIASVKSNAMSAEIEDSTISS
ncbi:MAG: YegP family protein [Saprospiraceae bacterium]|nr:YegP family protein [Saprospiraceae bacterium]MBK8298757.1 YegP family protein [Saprospiraceae bacterium]